MSTQYKAGDPRIQKTSQIAYPGSSLEHLWANGTLPRGYEFSPLYNEELTQSAEMFRDEVIDDLSPPKGDECPNCGEHDYHSAGHGKMECKNCDYYVEW